MEHIAAIMLVVVCNNGGHACEEAGAPQVVFETMQECTGALSVALGGARAGNPIFHGRCAAVDPAWLEEDVEISWRVSKRNGLEVDVHERGREAEMAFVENSRLAARSSSEVPR